jgi:squalene cyclase
MTAEAGLLQQSLLIAQNPDGGWAYQEQGTSWTEPSALALLALAAQNDTGPAYIRGRSWLLQTQKTDGGWAPAPAVDTSTSMTSVAVLALADAAFQTPALARGVRWLLEQENGETPALERIALHFLGAAPPKAPGGSPWFPGTAAWIAPTALSVLALARAARTGLAGAADVQRLRPAIKRAQQYLLSRTCRDGGWNHGGSSVRSEDAESYPEMTGLALLALQGVSPAELQRPLRRAEAFLAAPQPTEALSWLQLALMRHGRPVQLASTRPVCRNTRDICLRLLALAGPDNDTFTEALVS